MRPYLLPAALLTLTLGACRGEPGPADAIVVSDSSGVAIVANDLTRLDATCSLGTTPTLSIGEEDGGEEYLLEGVNGVRRLSDGRIVLVNQSTWQVRWYDAAGKYIRSAGRQGEGPGEFTSPYTVHVLPGDTAYVGNTSPFQFLLFGPDGEYVRYVRPEPMLPNAPRTFGLLADGSMMLGFDVNDVQPPGATGMSLQMRRIQLNGADGRVLDTLATVPNGRSGRVIATSNISTTPLFESYAHAMARDSIIVLGHGAQRELQVWTGRPEMRIVRLIRWTGESLEVKPSDIEADRVREKAELDRADPRFRQFAEMAYETHVHPSRPVADVMPAMNGIRLGTDGRIWIREFSTLADTSARRWVAFTREGRFDCRLRTPQFRDFAEFGADYLLVVDADSLGVQRVKQYPLTKD